MQHVRLAVLGAIVAVLAAACVTAAVPPSPTAPPPSPIAVHPAGATPIPGTPGPGVFQTGPYTAAEFWEYVVPGGDNVEHYDSLAAMTKAADAVVIGTVVGLRIDADRYRSVNLGGDLCVTMTLKVERTLAGKVNESAPGETNLSVFITDPRQYGRFAAGLPTERAVFFLRNEFAVANTNHQSHLPNDRIYYIVVDDQGLIRDVGGAAVPATPDGDFGNTLTGTPFDRVVSNVVAAAS